MIAEHLVERLLGIDGPRVNRKAGAFGWESALRLRKSKLVADQIHQVGRLSEAKHMRFKAKQAFC